MAEDVGLNPGAPGCTANVMIIASDQPDALAQQLVEERRRAFRVGGSGMDRGSDALEDFVASDAPVRWWQVSMPVDSQTGQRAVSIPGECTGSCSTPYDFGPVISTFAASRLTTQIVDELFRTIVILDFNQVASVSAQQLLTVPPYFLGAIACASTAYVSWRVERRGIFMILCAPLTVLGYAIFLGTDNPHARYGAIFLPFLGMFLRNS